MDRTRWDRRIRKVDWNEYMNESGDEELKGDGDTVD